VSDFEDTGLIDLIVKLGPNALDKLPPGVKQSKDAVAEIIVNNMRKVIIDEHALNPKFYDRMSELLDAILEERRKQALDYEQYLAKILEAAQQLGTKDTGKTYPSWAKHDDADLAFAIDSAIRNVKQHGWVDNPIKQKQVKRAIARLLPAGDERLETLFDLVRSRDEYR
jgi:type I restriction enzyme R subunit